MRTLVLLTVFFVGLPISVLGFLWGFAYAAFMHGKEDWGEALASWLELDQK